MAELADIAQTIKSARLRQGISQANAAAEIGVQRLQWVHWEAGRIAPSDENRPKVAALLDIDERKLRRDPGPRVDPLTRMIREIVESEVERALRRAERRDHVRMRVA